MTEDLQPFVRDLLEEAIEARGLDMDVVQRLLAKAKEQEGQALEETVRAMLRRA